MAFRPTTFRLKNKVVLNIILAAIVLELISGAQFYYFQNMLADELEMRAETELTMKAMVVKSSLNLSENSLMGHLWEMERNIAQPDSMFGIMEGVLRSHPNLVGCWIAFVPDYYPNKGRLFEPYSYWDHGTIRRQIIGPEHDYSQSDAYKKVVSEDVSLWVDPYYDRFSGLNLVSYAVPIHDKKKDVVAVFGLDISTKWLGDTLNYRHIYESSIDLLLTREGKLVAGPKPVQAKASDVKHIVDILKDNTVAKHDSKNGKCKVATFNDPDDKEKGYVYFTSFKGKPDWQIAVVCYDDEVFGSLRRMHLTILLTSLAGIILLGFIISYFIKNNKKLENTKKEKERIDSELRVASNIQMQMLPKQKDSQRDDIEVYGSLVPAREVGGDLFDYFVRDEKLFFCIGDVSGKGVPSAMLMAVMHTWFRATATHHSDPAHIMRAINEASCEGNESNMFVTLFIGILDLPTGRLCYCNAGHDAPIVLRSNEERGSLRHTLTIGQRTRNEAAALEVKANLPVGVLNDFNYKMQEATMEKDSMLLLYTDGLTEAMNKERKQFGIDRVMTLLNSVTESSPKQLLEAMSHEVKAFTNGTEQSDDLTMLAIRYTPKQFDSEFTETLTLIKKIRNYEL